MPSQTAGSARAPVFGHAPTASESAHTEGEKNSGDGRWGREGEREREGKEKAATSSPAYKTRKGSSQQEENKKPK